MPDCVEVARPHETGRQLGRTKRILKEAEASGGIAMAMNIEAWMTLASFFALLAAYNYCRAIILELRLEDEKKKNR